MKINAKYLGLLLFLLAFRSNAQVQADSLAGTYVGDHWSSWDYPTPNWTITHNDTMNVTNIDSTTCTAVASMLGWYAGSLPYRSMYYSCTTSLPANNYIFFRYNDSMICVKDFLWTGSLYNSNRFYGKRISVTHTSIKESIQKAEIRIWPNPANQKINIQSPSELGTIKIYNTIGEIAFQTQSNNKTEQLDIRYLTNGIYFFKVETKEVVFTKKIVVQH